MSVLNIGSDHIDHSTFFFFFGPHASLQALVLHSGSEGV